MTKWERIWNQYYPKKVIRFSNSDYLGIYCKEMIYEL